MFRHVKQSDGIIRVDNQQTAPSPGLISRVHQVLDVVVGGDGELGQILHVRTQQRMLSHTQVSFVFGVQQVPHTFTVDLHVADLYTDKI